ncbi:polysaccharide lyase 8 family protein [Clostridium sp. LP20]|uniref:polysaccharide lyase 8 family protein n=1 Tax=Clostridium sp. LP20 TaxID=3418665 RepID=UPI003EE54E4F
MNRKKIKMLIVRGLAIACITNVVIGGGSNIITAKAFAEQRIESEILRGEDRSSTALLNEDFSITKNETDNTWKTWWENSVRPSEWQLRKWGGASATGSNTPYGKVIEDSSKDGGKYVEVTANNTVGFFQPDSFIKISPEVGYKLKLKIKTDGIGVSEPLSVRVEYYDEKGTVLERKDVKKLSGTTDWTEYEVEIGTKTKATKMKVIFVFGNVVASSKGATGSFAIDSLSVNTDTANLEKIDFESPLVNLGLGSLYRPKGTLYPSHSKEKYTLVSSNEAIAKIKDGLVYAEGIGSTTIKAISESGKDLGAFTIKVGEDKTIEYNKALDGIFETMVPNSIIDLNDEQTVNTIKTQVDNGRKYWNSMNKSQDKKGLWDDATSTTNSAHVTTQYNRLYDMAVAYTINGSDLKGNRDLLKDIKDGLQWLKENRYDGKKFYNNWWDWEVGTPQKLNSILIILKSEFTDLEILEYTDVVDIYVKDPTMHTQGRYPAVGANRADMCKVVIYNGLLSKNEDRINLGVSKLDPLFKYVEEIIEEEGQKIDGYYKDGSWIEHGNIPYAGSYGAVLIGGVGEMAHVLNNTPWAIDEDKLNTIYEVILDSFEPLMYKGVMMNMVSGRAISRANERDYGHGFGIMRRILAFYTESAPEEYKDRYKAMIKEWIESNDKRDIIGTSTNLQFTVQAKALMKDDTVSARGELIGNYNFPNMDRVVHRRPGYVFGLSMYSSRVANYESLNGENLKGYHTSDGMTYLYNGDIGQYSNDFWPTVDSKRLPGTTVDTKNIFGNVAGTSYGPGETATSMQDWVGGANLGDYGVSGMYLDNKRSNPKKDLGMDLEAKKSYFMFDNEIVALGAGVTSTKDNGIETIFENRLINKDNDKIYINGQELTENIDNETKIDDAKWAYLEGEDTNSSIGYYFPKSSSINVKRDTRTGSWKEINNGQSATPITNTFFTMWEDHGTNPTNDSYEYVLLPNISKDDTASYAEGSQIEVVENNEDVQAVKENNKGIFAANFWNDKEIEVEGLKVNGKASVIMQKENGILDISVSDPTMKNNGVITVQLNEKAEKLISNDENVEVISNGDSIILKINVDKSAGQSLNAKIKLVSESDNGQEDTGNKPGDNDNKPGDNNNSGEIDKDKVDKEEPTTNPVKTSDTGALGILGSLFALGAGGLAISRKKK